ncbi:type II toxin-antitoxin system VapB family antitoxin [Ramlibacter sp. WS9]|uniref:type II toxin-antitoxin system VapB family antitoxin n=1 Tax=Ramlibacter sp. WS9 TaxID=1882741 RepID=UPI001142FC8A|nr:type II toxin-antitoxin system VapB family antitoxin [Ramlibacter sp. WS9]ROZ78673.1 type II toxin-antitoxin system VapB family antitoxin [Ramlibacter sp. WS9]
MRINLAIDDTLLQAAMKAGPFSSVQDAVDAGLRLLVRRAAYGEILSLRGKLPWDDVPKGAHGRVARRRVKD